MAVFQGYQKNQAYMVGMLLNFNQFFFLNIAKFSFAKKYISCSSKHWTRKKFDFLKVRHNEIFLLKTFQTFKHLQYFFFRANLTKFGFSKVCFFFWNHKTSSILGSRERYVAQYSLNKIISELAFLIILCTSYIFQQIFVNFQTIKSSEIVS